MNRLTDKDRRATYLGDGLYVDVDNGQVRLFATDGIAITNVVYLDADVLEMFQHWLAEKNI